MKYVLLICAIFLSLVITFDLFLKEPPVWPDEGGLAQFAVQAGNNPLNYYSYPSVYIVGLSFWFKLLGVSIVSQRLFSVFGGLLTVIIFTLIFKNIGLKNFIFKIIGLVLLITDFTFLQSTRVGRPEIWTIFFGLLSIYSFLKYINSGFKNYIFFILSLFSSVIAFLFHMNGIIFTLIILIVSIINYKKIITYGYKKFFILSIIVLPILIWIGSRFLFLFSYLLLRLKIGVAQDTWLISVFTGKPLELKLVYLSFVSITAVFIIFYFKRSSSKSLLLLISLILSWAVVIFNRDFWYAVFPVAFIILSLMILLDFYFEKWKLDKSSNNYLKLFGLFSVLIILILSNSFFHFNILMSEGGDKYSYEKFIREIQQNIPDNKTVFSSSIPDTYFAFTDRKNNKLERFPQSFVYINDYIDIFNNTDYIIFNGLYGDNYYGDIVAKYIDKNKSNIIKIGEPNQYQAYIIELKPRDQRQNP